MPRSKSISPPPASPQPNPPRINLYITQRPRDVLTFRPGKRDMRNIEQDKERNLSDHRAGFYRNGLPPGHLKLKTRRICLVTSEFHGLFKNGGIGTANTGLALELATAGWDVSVLYTDCDDNGPRTGLDRFKDVASQYLRSNIPGSFTYHNISTLENNSKTSGRSPTPYTDFFANGNIRQSTSMSVVAMDFIRSWPDGPAHCRTTRRSVS